MMTVEAIFSVFFVGILILIPFAAGVHLSRALRRRRDAEALFSETQSSSGRVVGYIKRKYDTENSGDYYMIVEHVSAQGECFWAQGDSCDKDELPINSVIDIMFHPRDKRAVNRVLSQDHAKTLMKIGKNIEPFINLIFTAIMIGVVIHEKGFALNVLIPFILVYAGGFVFGLFFNGEKSDEKIRAKLSGIRNRILINAQRKGAIPCYIEE